MEAQRWGARGQSRKLLGRANSELIKRRHVMRKGVEDNTKLLA